MSTPTPSSSPSPVPTPVAELPRGGYRVFPEHRLVGFSGGRAESFGRLGVGDIDDRAEEIETLGEQYSSGGKKLLPIFELIAVVAHGSPTSSGLYRTREPAEVVEAYLDAARRHDALLLLNIQPGRAGFLPEVQQFEQWLREPDVGIALDPEWAVGPGEVPGRVIGSRSGSQLDKVATYLSELVRTHDLPEKVLVYHQFHAASVADEHELRPHPGVVVVKSVDGVGVPQEKVATWNRLTRSLKPHVYSGFKLFYEEDTRRGPLMTPSEVLALRPQPSYVLYE